MSKILITGAAGFIGRHVVEYLISDGVKKKDLRLFVYKDELLDNLSYTDFDIIRGDIRSEADVEKAMQGIGVIYHLAALTMHGEGKYMDVNWRGTKNLLKFAKKMKVKKIIFFSTIAVFGLPAFNGSRTNIDEESEKRVIGEYAKSKKMAENELIRANKTDGIPYVIVRPTTVYGPGDKAGIYQLYKSIKAHRFVRIGNGKNKMDYVYVTDVVRGARLAELSLRKTGDYILGARKPISFGEIVDMVSGSMSIRIPSWYIPRSAGLVLGYVADILNSITGLRIPLSADRVKVMTADYYFNSSKAMRELGYNPKVTFKKGSVLTTEWLEMKGEM